jgi:CRP-like cAMP-binding protein
MAGAFASLSRALGELKRAEERRLLDSLVRVGCQTALERTAALFLELYARCASIGFVQDGSFLMPLTQEVLGRMLGISVVHVNRVIAELKSCGLVEVRKGSATILDFPKLRQLAGEVADRCQANHVEYGKSYRAA